LDGSNGLEFFGKQLGSKSQYVWQWTSKNTYLQCLCRY